MKISLYKRKLTSGRISLFIEYYRGSQIDENGKRRHLRDYENLKIYLHDNPTSSREKTENRENLQLAENILAIRKSEYIQGRFDIKNQYKTKSSFLDFFEQLVKDRHNESSKNNYDNWNSCLKHLQKFISPNFTFEEINEQFIKEVKFYFDKKAQTKSNTSLSLNSKYSYFNKFKSSLRKAFEEGYLSINYAQKVKSFEQKESQREYLTHEELQRLAYTRCKHQILKKAFIFSCLTGIRWSDIHALTWSEIRDEEDISRVNFRQKKTDGVEYLYISKQARELLGKRLSPNDRVFIGLRYSSYMNVELQRWVSFAGITKSITFHCARHTNAVLLLENGADIYTVSKRLGHREIRTTEIYAKIVDKKMKEAAEIIPEIKIIN